MTRTFIPGSSKVSGQGLAAGKIALITCMLLLIPLLGLKAQDPLLKRADQAYQDLAFPEAIRLYQKVLKKKFNKTAMIRLADCYRLTNQYELAAEQYAKVVDINQLPPVNYFYYAQSLMNNGMFREAEKWFLRYQEAAPDDPRGIRFAESCRDIEGFYRDSAQYRLKLYRFNSTKDDFAPAWYRDGIIFASSSGAGEVMKSRYEWNEQPFLDLYYAKVDSSGNKSTRPRLLNARLNTRFHEAACSVDETNGLLYFTRNNYFKGKRGQDNSGMVNLKVFYARLEENGMGELRALPFNSDAYSVGHPAIDPAGNVLYFVSDMPGGYGGTDIYMAERNGDSWSKPQNLGQAVNSAGNEMFPFVHADGSLYFASDGLGGLGGLDLFRVSFPLDETRPPRNLGAPFNSPSDDFGYISSRDKLWGFISSNRPGGTGGDDLYQFSVCRPGLSGLVLDSETLQPIPGAHIVARYTGKEESEQTQSDAGGNFDLLLAPDDYYRIEVTADGYTSTTRVFNTVGQRPGMVVRDTVYLDPPSLQVAFRVLDAETGSPVPNVRIRVRGRNFEATTDSAGEFNLHVSPYPEEVRLGLECVPQDEPEYCYHFSDEGGLDTDTLPVIYEWSLGDGTKRRGLEVNHCYEAPGIYHVELNLVDTTSGFLFMNQTGYDLEIRPPQRVYMAGPDTVVRGLMARFDARDSYLADCDIRSWAWEVEGKPAGNSPVLDYTFTKEGNYEIGLHVNGDSQSGPRSCRKCVTRRLTVLGQAERRKTSDSLRVAWAAPPAATPPADIRCTMQEPESYCFNFSDEGGLKSDSLPYVYQWDMGDGTRRRGEEVAHCYAHPGQFQVRLQVIDPYTDVPLMTQAEYEVDVRDIRQVYVESHDSARTGQPVKFSALGSDPKADCRVNSVFWDFGDGQTAIGPEVSHAYLRPGTFRVRMVLSGKSAQGANCEDCSYKEVTVSSDYRGYPIADAGLEKTLVQPKYLDRDEVVFLEVSRPGYKTRVVPFVPGNAETSILDSIRLEKQLDELALEGVVVGEDGKTPLRDVYLHLLNEEGEELKRLNTKTGEFSLPVIKGRVYELMAQKQGYLSERVRVGPVTAESLMENDLTMVLEPVIIGKTFTLKDIYYDFNKFSLRRESEAELMKLVRFLRDNPGLQVELGSHTDARGSDSYNLWLSQKRAESAVGYLKKQGLGTGRILARGYGEQRLVNGCANGVNCEETAHQLNRRTEITILGFSDARYQEALLVFGEGADGASKAGFSIELGVFDRPLAPDHHLGQLELEQNGSSYLYRLTGFADYQTALNRLAEVRTMGFPAATIRSTVDKEQSEPPSAQMNGMPMLAAAEFYYTIQIAVVARSVPAGYFAPLGDYQTQLQVFPVGHLNKYCVCRIESYHLARRHLARIRALGYSDAFIVPYENGVPVGIDAALARERKQK